MLSWCPHLIYILVLSLLWQLVEKVGVSCLKKAYFDYYDPFSSSQTANALAMFEQVLDYELSKTVRIDA